MKKIATLYGFIAAILEIWLARVYQAAVPAFRHVYAEIFGDGQALPHLTVFLLNHNWTFYLPPIGIFIGYILGLRKQDNRILPHSIYWGLIFFLGLGVLHAFALFLPLIVTIGKIE